VIAIGTTVLWNGRRGVVRSMGFSKATERQIATVDFGREVLRLPVDDLNELEERK
jgi:hypothetical protein